MSRAEHEALVEAVARKLYDMELADEGKPPIRDSDWETIKRMRFGPMPKARAIIALIAQKLETVTEEMARPVSEAIMNAWQEGSSDRICAADTYLMMLRASPLFPGKDP